MAVGGSTIALATLVSSGWGAALAVEAFTIAATIGYYVVGGRDSDVGAMLGGRPDERQVGVETKAAAVAGIVTSVVALGGFVVATAVGSAVWPFALFCCVSAASFLAGLVIYRSGG
jgi:hypothetical protein